MQRADAQPAKSRGIGPFGSLHAPVKISLGPGGVHGGINGAIVSFLKNDQAVRPRLDDGLVLFGFHGPDFQRDRWNFRPQGPHAIGQILAGDKFGMFPRDEQNIAKAQVEQRPRLAHRFIDTEGHA